MPGRCRYARQFGLLETRLTFALHFAFQFLAFFFLFGSFTGSQAFACSILDFHSLHAGVIHRPACLQLLHHLHAVTGTFASHALHERFHYVKLFDQLRDNGCLNSCTIGNASSALCINESWVFPLFHRHAVDRTDGLANSARCFVALEDILELAHAWHQAHHFAHQPRFGHLFHHRP